MAALLGAHIIKVKPPTAHLEQAEAAKVYADRKIDSASLSAIEAALITLLNVSGWADSAVTCKAQIYRGTYGPFWDAQDGQVHYQSLTFQSYIV